MNKNNFVGEHIYKIDANQHWKQKSHRLINW
jgi:hypothetical protein